MNQQLRIQNAAIKAQRQSCFNSLTYRVDRITKILEKSGKLSLDEIASKLENHKRKFDELDVNWEAMRYAAPFDNYEDVEFQYKKDDWNAAYQKLMAIYYAKWAEAHPPLPNDEEDVDAPPAPLPVVPADQPIKPYPNIFMEKKGGMQHQFTDVLIKTGSDFNTGLPNTVKIAPPQAGVALGFNAPTKTSYKGHVLADGDVIRSVAVFRIEDKAGAANAAPTKQPVVGILKQDHTGNVFDVTTDVLTDHEKMVMALKQAKMLLSNCDETKIRAIPNAALVITGNGEEEAKQAYRVWAALLLLKKDNPSFPDIPIEAHITGCKRPVLGPMVFNIPRQPLAPDAQERANEAFIRKHLAPDVIKQGEGEQLGLRGFTPARDRRKQEWDDTKRVLDELRPPHQPQEQRTQIWKRRLNELTDEAGDIDDDQQFGLDE